MSKKIKRSERQKEEKTKNEKEKREIGKELDEKIREKEGKEK